MSVTFSVITPSYQQGQFIERTIQSVITQSGVAIDYVICDGGSRDETLSILKRYQDCLRWISEPDRGQADAVNKGLSMTTGDIIAWINSDDVYYHNAFKTVSACFEADSDVMAVYGQADWIDEHDRVIAAYPVRPWSYRQLKRDCYLCQPAVFFRRQLIDTLGVLDSQLQYCMDYELWLRYGRQYPFTYLPTKLADSRVYASNKTFGGQLAAHHEANYMLKEKIGRSNERLIFGYSKLQTEGMLGCFAAKSTKSLGLWLRFSVYFFKVAIANCWHLNKRAIPFLLLKIIVYQLSMNSKLLKQKQSLSIEEIVFNRSDKEQNER